MRVDAAFLALELQPRDAEADDGLLLARGQVALDPDEAALRGKALGELALVHARQRARELRRRLGGPLRVAADDHRRHDLERQVEEAVGLAPGVAVRAAHERVADHGDAEEGKVAAGRGVGDGREAHAVTIGSPTRPPP